MRSRRAVGLAEIQIREVGFGHRHFPIPGLVSSTHTHTFRVSVSAERQQQRPRERSPASLAPAHKASSRPSPSCGATALAMAEFHPDAKGPSSFCCQTSPQPRGDSSAPSRAAAWDVPCPQGAALGGETASHGDGCERGGTRAGAWATQFKQAGAGLGPPSLHTRVQPRRGGGWRGRWVAVWWPQPPYPSAPEQEGAPGMLHPTGMPPASAQLRGIPDRGHVPPQTRFYFAVPRFCPSRSKAGRASASPSLAGEHSSVVTNAWFMFKAMPRRGLDPIVGTARVFCDTPLSPPIGRSCCADTSNALF